MHFFFSKRFLPLFVTQFLGAFNDNFLKNALVVLLTYRLADKSGQNPQVLVALAAGLFILPYFLFAALSGQLADKWARNLIARWVKLAEIVLMILALIGFIYESVWFLMLVLFLMGVHSTFFSPVKYSLLPQHLKEKELLSGNASIGAGTFLAILLGTICGGLLILRPMGEIWGGSVLILMAIIGYISSRMIPDAPPPVPDLRVDWNPWKETVKLIHYSRNHVHIHRAILAISWFWFVGATFLAQFPAFARDILHADETVVTLFLTMFSVGVGVGSFLCNRLLKGQVKLTFILWAAIGMSICALDLAWVGLQFPKIESGEFIGVYIFLQQDFAWRITLDLFMLAVCGGVYVVPLYAYMQHYGDPAHLARLVATNNIINAVYMVGSSLFIIAMVAVGASIPQIFLAVAGLNIILCLWLYCRRLDRQIPQDADHILQDTNKATTC